MIELINLSFNSGNKDLLGSISVTLHRGDITGIVGRTGSGKTILLKIISRIIDRYSGDVIISKRPLPSFSKKELLKMISSFFGIMAENPDETLLNFLMLSRLAVKKFFSPFNDYDKQITDEYIQSLELYDYKDKKLCELPESILKKTLLAYAFAREAEILVFDNPVSGLDLHSIELFKRALQKYTMNGDKIAIIASSDINFLAQTADRILILEKGKLASDIVPEAIDVELIKKYFNADVLISRNIYTGKPEIHFFS